MRRLQFGIAATQSLGLPQAAERRCRGLGAFFWLLGSAGSGNTYSLWDHQNRADPGLGLVVADTANVPSRPQNMVVAAFLEKDLFFNGLLGHDWLFRGKDRTSSSWTLRAIRALTTQSNGRVIWASGRLSPRTEAARAS